MEARRFSIKPDTPELKALCDAISRAQGNPIMEIALSQYVSRLVVSAMADPRFIESLSQDAAEAKAKAKQERIGQLRNELAKLESEQTPNINRPGGQDDATSNDHAGGPR